MPGISSKMLTERLRTLGGAEIINRRHDPTVPPKVTYELTKEGRELTTILDQINTLADRWQDQGNKKANINIQAKEAKRRMAVSGPPVPLLKKRG